ncbi:MAG TPA: hypothetical protein VH120_02490 [Gemmataceae bacterium]|jgi:hypothetical protein|nr:hypothetical protein [Gemmataceae bacterium]
MRFWWREILGWALVALGIVMFLWAGLLMTFNNQVLATGPLTLAGIIVFRGGIHLLKVAVAARICTEAAAELRRRDTA